MAKSSNSGKGKPVSTLKTTKKAVSAFPAAASMGNKPMGNPSTKKSSSADKASKASRKSARRTSKRIHDASRATIFHFASPFASSFQLPSSLLGKWVSGFLIAVLLGAVMGSTGEPIMAAKKKKEAEVPAEPLTPPPPPEDPLKKELVPVTKSLTTYLSKVESRFILTPQESQKLVELKYKLMEMMQQHAGNTNLQQPVYQAAMIFQRRDDMMNAYDLFQYLSDTHPTTFYGRKAKIELFQLSKKLGPDFFPKLDPLPAAEVTPPPGAAAATATDPAATGKDGAAKDPKADSGKK